MAIKILLTTAMLITVLFCGKAQTNEAGKQTAVATNKPPAKTPNWFANEKKYQGEANSNGFACELWVKNDSRGIGLQQPVCIIYVINTSTGIFYSWNSPTNSLGIDLLDDKGRAVEKKDIGKLYEATLNAKQLSDLYYSRQRTKGITQIYPESDNYFTTFSIPQLFVLEEPGEYTLRVKMRLIKHEQSECKTTWLPEVTAKVQIRSADIPPPDLPPNAQTNSMTK
jgi:hypothetical protein